MGYTGLYHRADQLFDEDSFDGDVNAIVDFKYSASDRVDWWFDHHQSAFLSEQDAAHFRADSTGTKFYDPSYKSCTKFIADTLRAKFDFDWSHLTDLIHWADILDGAQHESARAAVAMESAALKLNLIIESAERNVTAEIIPLLETESLESIVARPKYDEVFRALYEKHLKSIAVIRDLAVCRDEVVFFRSGPHAHEGIQQVRSLLPLPKEHVHGVRARRGLSGQGVGRFESMASGFPAPQSRGALRAVRRRRPSARRRNQLRP